MDSTAMISETSFSRGFTSFWTEYTPWLGDFVSSINKGIAYRTQVPIELTEDSTHRSTNNVIAFTLFKNIIESDNSKIDDAYKEAQKIVSNYPRNNLDTYSLTDDYAKIIDKLATRLVNRYENKEIEIYPQFNGCGIMESCQGDLYYKNTLAEIKAGDRATKSSDIKQVITYCALDWLSGNSFDIQNIEIYNPRQGILWESELSDLILSISSLPMEDLFDFIGKYLSELSESIEL
jgi:hypothetical protein